MNISNMWKLSISGVSTLEVSAAEEKNCNPSVEKKRTIPNPCLCKLLMTNGCISLGVGIYHEVVGKTTGTRTNDGDTTFSSKALHVLSEKDYLRLGKSLQPQFKRDAPPLKRGRNADINILIILIS